MPGFIAGIAAGWAAQKIGTIADNALGRPFELWTAQVQAENAASVRASGFQGNFRTANALPSPDAVYSAYRRGLITDNVAAQVLLAHGISPTEVMVSRMPDATRARLLATSTLTPGGRQMFSKLWENISYMGMQRPDVGAIAQAVVTRRLTPGAALDQRRGLDVSWGRYAEMAEAQYVSPGWDTLIQMRRLGRITQAQYELWSARAGWTNASSRGLAESISTMPSPTECLVASWRGGVTPTRLREYGNAAGFVHDEDWRTWMRASVQLPGPSDIVRMAVREAWDSATVTRFGYDEEFPPEFAHWAGWWGLNWGEPVTLPDGRVLPAVTWPKAYWRAHWQIMSPEQAYRALHLLRPDRLARYREIAPGLTAFGPEDLRTILKVQDYPPAMRKWLAAINTVPLRISTIRAGYNLGTYTDAQAIELLLDRGHVREDAVAQIDVWRRQWNWQVSSWARSLRYSTYRATAVEVIQAFKDGIQTKEGARLALGALGLQDDYILPALALASAQVAREEVREALTALRRAWIQGQLSAEALRQSLVNLGLDPSAQARYLRRWVRQRGLSRRMLSVGQVLSAVSTGALAAPIAALSLANLNLAPTDSALLLSQAGARLAQLQARQSARVAAQAKASQRERVAALRQAESAARRLRAQLRSTTPLTSLRRWFALGIRSGQWIARRLALLGYDSETSDAFLREWVMENERAPHPEAPAVEGAEKLARRQTSRATVKVWFQLGVVTEAWTRRRLSVMGYSDESIALFIREWFATLGKKPGPAAAPVYVPEQPAPGAPPGARQLDNTPRVLSQEPRPAGP